MILFQLLIIGFLLSIRSTVIFAQTSSYTAYQTAFPYVTSCPSHQYFDVALLQCLNCSDNAQQKRSDSTQCDCVNGSYYYGVNQGGGSLLCIPCTNTNYVRSSDGFGCVLRNSACPSGTINVFTSELELNGSLYSGISASNSQPRIGSEICNACADGTWPEQNGQRCVPCASLTPRLNLTSGQISCCAINQTSGGMCLSYVEDTTISIVTFLNRFSTPSTSAFFQQHLKAAFHLCRMNLNAATAQPSPRTLLSNATACHLLGNIAAMQFFYGATGYTYYLYDQYIWMSQDAGSVWQIGASRPSIPFLKYPPTFYDEMTSTSYNWITAGFKQNDLVRLKLAKYSATGEFLGLLDAFDAHLQLCGGGYTHGRAAFTFGAQYKRSCYIRADALWSSDLYETAFFDPYIVFTRSGSDYILPTPVVIWNFQEAMATTSFPNKLSDDSQWVYHHRFFLLDRISGVTPTNASGNIHYAKSIKIRNTLAQDQTYIQPPVISIEYAELSFSNIGKGTLVEISFESTYEMYVTTQTRDIWIAVGVISVFGLIFAFIKTIIWQSRSGKLAIELETILVFIVYVLNIVGTIFFIVMAGVSLWWIIFFKRQDVISLVLPTAVQQQSFVALISVAFALKTIDIIHLIISQARQDIFFIDWEKSKGDAQNNVSAWRTYFVVNEYQEIQAFRRINVTFQLFFVLFLLKVINLENIATGQPGVNLFPSTNDYQSDYNGMLRVGIGFSMWLATGIIQYLYYVVFHQRFIEDKIINFIDLCSVSNISVFILSHPLYGYYIHGRSPHGTTDVNMKDMLMNLEREAKQMSGSRGLEAKSNEQTFIMKLNPAFRSRYLEPWNLNANLTQLPNINRGNGGATSDTSATIYRQLNEFLSAFINHSLPSHNYIIRDRMLIEKFLNHEFDQPYQSTTGANMPNIFYFDPDKNFKKVMFSGHENSLFIWNMATFLFIDYFAFNYVLAAIITYIFNYLAIKLRMSLGRRSLSNRAFIPKEFLI